MKFGVITFPGSNCDYDTLYVLKKILSGTNHKVEHLWHKERNLKNCDFIILPGGFSYGDYLRAGAIAKFSPIMEEVINHANKGAYVLGICNGFQILCETNLLPGILLMNNNMKFICKNVKIKVENNNTIITNKAKEKNILNLPIAHSEGRYYIDNSGLEKLKKNKQIIFRYCNNEGDTVINANPNGSIENIAGICNENFNVFGMMPHPERASDKELRNTDGKIIFDSILNYYT